MTAAATFQRGDLQVSPTTDWIPGAIIAVIGSALSLWRGQAVMEAKFEDLSAQTAKERTELLAQFERDKAAAAKTDKALTAEIRDALHGLQNVATEIKIVSVEQSAFNRMTTKTLESVLAKVEQHDKVLQEHSTSLALLISGRRFEEK